jgi:hypothetical protein
LGGKIDKLLQWERSEAPGEMGMQGNKLNAGKERRKVSEEIRQIITKEPQK